MAPNLFLATRTLFTPHRWFTRQNSGEKPVPKSEHWDLPIPGTYDYIPGRGWFLCHADSPDSSLPPLPVRVTYSKVVKRYLLQPEYDSRKRFSTVTSSDGRSKDAGFFRLDDGIAWVNAWDEEGRFVPGPYALWCIDKTSGHFRPMLKGDSPNWVSRNSSRQGSFTSGSRSPSSSRPSSSGYHHHHGESAMKSASAAL